MAARNNSQVRSRLQALLPQSCPTAVAATGISQDQQLHSLRKGCLALVFPPAGNRVDRKGWRVSRGANVDRPTVVDHVVDAIGHGSSQAVAREIMDVDRDRLEAPGA